MTRIATTPMSAGLAIGTHASLSRMSSNVSRFIGPPSVRCRCEKHKALTLPFIRHVRIAQNATMRQIANAQASQIGQASGEVYLEMRFRFACLRCANPPPTLKRQDAKGRETKLRDICWRRRGLCAAKADVHARAQSCSICWNRLARTLHGKRMRDTPPRNCAYANARNVCRSEEPAPV